MSPKILAAVFVSSAFLSVPAFSAWTPTEQLEISTKRAVDKQSGELISLCLQFDTVAPYMPKDQLEEKQKEAYFNKCREVAKIVRPLIKEINESTRK